MNDFEVERCAQLAAKKAITEWLLMLGVDASSPQEILSIQRDFATLRAIRQNGELISKRAITGLVGAAITALLGMIWYYAKIKGVE